MTAPSLGYFLFSSTSCQSISSLHIAPTILCVAPLYPTTSSAALQVAYAVVLALVISTPRSDTANEVLSEVIEAPLPVRRPMKVGPR